jgi:uncharacterized protein YegP (UPF0339 family)
VLRTPREKPRGIVCQNQFLSGKGKFKSWLNAGYGEIIAVDGAHTSENGCAAFIESSKKYALSQNSRN